MTCCICKQDKNSLEARAFHPGGGYEFGPWYCHACAEAEKQTEPWKRGYTQAQTEYVKKVETSIARLFIPIASLVIISAAIGFILGYLATGLHR